MSAASSDTAAVKRAARRADLVIMAAAVADYTPVQTAAEKIKKGAALRILRLKKTADILADLGDNLAGQVGIDAGDEHGRKDRTGHYLVGRCRLLDLALQVYGLIRLLGLIEEGPLACLVGIRLLHLVG